MKKWTLLLIGIFLLFSCKKELPAPIPETIPDDWTKVASMPLNEERMGAVTFSIDNKGYVATGYNKKIEILENDLWMYDPISNSWSQKASLPFEERRISATVFTIGTKAYVFGGRDKDNDTLRDLWEYDSQADTWTEKQSLPPAGFSRYGAAGFSIGGKGYVLGGAKDAFVNLGDLWEYDPQTDTWLQKHSLPIGEERSFSSVFILNDRAYICGGRGNIGTHSSAWEYDPQTDTWLQKASMPYKRSSSASFSLNSKGHLVCGNNQNSYQTDTFLQYDPQADQWTEKTPFPEKRRDPGIFFVLSGVAYVGGGIDDSTVYGDLYKFNPSK